MPHELSSSGTSPWMKFWKASQWLFYLSFGLVMLYLAFRGTDVAAIGKSIAQADYRWVGLSLLVTFLCHLARAWRWNLLIEALGEGVRFRTVFLSMMSGYFVNTAVPRLGEISRCMLMQRESPQPFAKLLGTVVTERIIDLVMLFLVLMSALVFQFDLLAGFFSDQLFSPLMLKVTGILSKVPIWIYAGAAIALAFGIYYRLKAKEKAKEEKIGKLEELAFQLEEGLLSALRLKRSVLFILLTLSIWVMYFFMTYLCFFSIPATSGLSVGAGLALVGIGSLGRSVPVQAGGMGAYHWILAQGLLLYGIAETDGLALATIIHATQTLFYLVTGGVCLALISFFYPKKSGS